ncbi:unnamed protein product, partial [Aureobasidium vineae]
MEPRLGPIKENIAFLAFLKHGGRASTYLTPLRHYKLKKISQGWSCLHRRKYQPKWSNYTFRDEYRIIKGKAFYMQPYRRILKASVRKILGRLRSKHAQHTNKIRPPLLQKLQQLLDILKKDDRHNHLRDSFNKRANKRLHIRNTFKRPSSAASNSRKSEMVINHESIVVACTFGEPCYTRYPILRNIRFEAVTMSNCPNNEQSIDLSEPDRGLFRSSSSLYTQETHQKISTAARQEGRVHAEIQLLCFYESLESNPGIIRPRVICSEKHACFLCDIFIKAHAQFYTPSTHGTFYPRWRLPKPGGFKISSTKIMSTLHRFNKSLEEEIIQDRSAL